MASGLYDSGRNAFARGDFLWKASGGSAFNCSLISSSYTPNYGTHTLYADASANLVGTTGVMTLIDPAAGACDANDQVYTSVAQGSTVSQVVIYVLGTVNSVVNPLLACVQFSNVSTNGGNITIQWQATTPFVFKL